MRVRTKEPVIVEFTKDKDTKNTVRFIEDEPGYVKMIYVDKSGHKKLGSPKKIRVTIESA